MFFVAAAAALSLWLVTSLGIPCPCGAGELLEEMLEYWTRELTESVTSNPKILSAPPAERLLAISSLVMVSNWCIKPWCGWSRPSVPLLPVISSSTEEDDDSVDDSETDRTLRHSLVHSLGSLSLLKFSSCKYT